MGLVISTAVLNVTPNVADATNSELSMAATHIGSDGVSSTTGTITVKDAYGVAGAGNIRDNADDTAILGVSTTAGTVSAITSQGSGVYTFTLTSADEVGTATVSATVSGAALGSADVDFNVDTASAADSDLEVAQATVQAALANEVVTITVKDDTGDIRTKARIDADAADEGITAVYDVVEVFVDGVSAGTATDNEDGTHTITLDMTTVGDDIPVTASVNGSTLADSALVDVTAAPASAAHSQLDISSTSISADSTAFTATVTLFDEFDNQITTGGDTVSYVSGASGAGTVVDNGDGTYSIPVTASTTADDYTLTVAVDSVDFTDTEDYTVIPGAASETTSIIVTDPINVLAGASAALEGHLIDAHGNRLLFSQGSAYTVTFDTSDDNSTVTIGSVTLTDDGGFTKHVSTISDTEAETLDVEMYINFS